MGTAKSKAATAGTVTYQRISEDRLGLEYGVDRQRAQAGDLCRQRGWPDAVEYLDNDISASHGEYRPGYAALVAAVERGEVARVVVFHPSRIWRNRRERAHGIELFKEHGVSLVCVRGPELDMGTAYGRLAADLVGAFDSAEGEIKTERINAEILQKAERGELNGAGEGNRLYGYEADGKTVVEAEAEQVRDWYRRFVAGQSLASLAREAGVYPSTMQARLCNPRYAGIRRHLGVDYKAAWEPIVDRDVWETAVRTLADPKRVKNGGSRERKHLGAGLYVCLRCGRDHSVYSSLYRSGGQSRHVYRCRPELGGCSRSWHRDRLDAYVNLVVEERLSREDLADLLPVARPDLQVLRDEAEGIRGRMKRLRKDYVLLGLDEAELADGLAEGRARLSEIEAVLGEHGRGGPLGPLVTAEDPVAYWRGITQVSRRQAIVRSLMTITLDAAPKGKPPGSWADSVVWFGASCARIEWAQP